MSAQDEREYKGIPGWNVPGSHSAQGLLPVFENDPGGHFVADSLAETSAAEATRRDATRMAARVSGKIIVAERSSIGLEEGWFPDDRPSITAALYSPGVKETASSVNGGVCID